MFIYSKRIKPREAGERAHDGDISPLPFQIGGKGAAVPFYEIVMGSFMVYQLPTETNLLQLFARPETSDWFSTFSGSIFEVNIVAEQKQA